MIICIWGYSSVGRAPALQAGGQGFESLHLHESNSFKRAAGRMAAAQRTCSYETADRRTEGHLKNARERENRRFSSAASVMKDRFSQSTPYLENYTLEKTSDIEMI